MMANIFRRIVNISRTVTAPVTMSSPKLPSPTSSLIQKSCRCYSRDPYNPYPTFESPSPYKKKEKYRHGYSPKLFTGGVLPRPDAFVDKRHPISVVKPTDRDQWTSKKALFGQNDYIDILGDGSIEPYQLMKGPVWLKGFKGNELQRVIRKRSYQGQFLKEHYPTKYHDMKKRIWYLYKQFNLRRRTAYFGSQRMSSKSRIDRKRKI